MRERLRRRASRVSGPRRRALGRRVHHTRRAALLQSGGPSLTGSCPWAAIVLQKSTRDVARRSTARSDAWRVAARLARGHPARHTSSAEPPRRSDGISEPFEKDGSSKKEARTEKAAASSRKPSRTRSRQPRCDRTMRKRDATNRGSDGPSSDWRSMGDAWRRMPRVIDREPAEARDRA